MYEFEKNKLYQHLEDGTPSLKSLIQDFKDQKVMIAGGAITSLFCNREINDIDVYFRTEEAALAITESLWLKGAYIVAHTKKATLWKVHDILIQLIHLNYYCNPEEIFKDFDFTVCMGCFDCGKDEFVLHPDFLKDNSQRILRFNPNTSYPIVSALRVQKYVERGYKISKPQFIRIILTCMDTKINSYEELKEHIGGMYGEANEKLFDDIEEEEFDLQRAIEKIANLTLSDDYFKRPKGIGFETLDKLLDSIVKHPKKYMKIKKYYYMFNYKGKLCESETRPNNGIEINPYEYFSKNSLYKFVKKEGNKYRSKIDNNFTYEIGKEVSAKGNLHNRLDHIGNLHFFQKEFIKSFMPSYGNYALLEVKINPDDLSGINQHILARKAFVIREVPKEEWEAWNK